MTTLKPQHPITAKISSRDTEQAGETVGQGIARCVDGLCLRRVDRRLGMKPFKARRRLCQTSVTEHLPGISMKMTTKAARAWDLYRAFRAPSKVPALRLSPAVMCWPTRPIVGRPVPTGRSTTKLPDIVLTSPDVSPCTGSPRSDCSPAPTYTGRGRVINFNDGLDVRPVTEESFSENSDDDDEDDDDESGVVAAGDRWRPVPYANFWDTATGGMRIDQHGVGTPRVDPHHSSWTPLARTCYFLHRPAPPHTRRWTRADRAAIQALGQQCAPKELSSRTPSKSKVGAAVKPTNNSANDSGAWRKSQK